MKPELTKKIIASVLSLVLVTSVVFSHYGFAAAAALGDAISTNSNADYVEKDTPDEDPSPSGNESVATGSNAQKPGSAEVATGSNAIKGPGIKIEALFGEELAAYLMELDEDELLETLETLTEEQWESLVDVVSEEQLEEWLWILASTKPVATASAASFTEAGPLVEPVVGMMYGMFRSGRMAQPIAEESDGLVLNKDVVGFDEETGEYKIRLEAYATGNVTTTEAVVPTDIVLVLDQSGSMSDNFSSGHFEYKKVDDKKNIQTGKVYFIKDEDGYQIVSYDTRYKSWGYNEGWHGWHSVNPISASEIQDESKGNYYFYRREWVASKTKLTVLKTAVTQFIGNVAQNAIDNNVGHRMAVVGFASESSNTELLSTTEEISYAPSNNKYKNGVKAALVPVVTNEEVNTRLTTAVNRLSASGSTRTDLGIKMSQDILSANPISTDEKRNRVVVVFTDGQPNNGSGFKESVANDAISSAHNLKAKPSENGMGATVYSIGIFEGADPEADFTGNGTNAKSNRFMHYISTNYPDATSLSNGGTANSNKNYYLTAADEEDLNNIFQSISDQIETPSIDLNENGVLKDTVSSYFSLPSGADGANKVTVLTANCTGKDGDAFIFDNPTPLANASVSVVNNQVSVSGFDYSENFVAVGDDNQGRGQKLIVEFPVVARDGFIGGNNVNTNTLAGIYQDQNADKTLKTAPSPEVNVQIRYDFGTVDKDIYIGDSVSLQELLNNAQYTIDGEKYSLGGGNNDFVTIEYQIKDGNEVIATYRVPQGEATGTWDAAGTVFPTEDKQYQVTAVVKPVTEGEGLEGYRNEMTGHTPGPKDSNVDVYKPEITTKDLAIYLTQKPENLDHGIDSVVWKHGDTQADEGVMGQAPGLEYGYDYSTTEGYPTEDTAVNIETVTRVDNAFEVKNGTDDYTTIHQTENGKSADFVVYVFKPEVPCTDEIVFYGDSTDLNQRIDIENISWTNETIESTELYPTGTAPDLAFTFQVLEGTALDNQQDAVSAFVPAEDTTFQVGVKVGNEDITSHTVMKNDGNVIAAGKPDFTIYVVKGQLNITKNIDEQYTKNQVLNASQSFVFRIDRRDTPNGEVTDSFYEVISFNANDSVKKQSKTIKGLRKGYYSVSEDTDWSWRYEETGRADNYDRNATACENIFIGDAEIPASDKHYFGVEENTVVKGKNISNPAAADFTNQRTNTNWLGDVARALNQIFKSAKLKSDAE